MSNADAVLKCSSSNNHKYWCSCNESFTRDVYLILYEVFCLPVSLVHIEFIMESVEFCCEHITKICAYAPQELWIGSKNIVCVFIQSYAETDEKNIAYCIPYNMFENWQCALFLYFFFSLSKVKAYIQFSHGILKVEAKMN